MSGRGRWCVGTFVLLAALVLAPSPSAQAHASLVGSTPTNGASLQQAPSQIRLWFDEPLRSGFGSFDLVDADGGTIPVRRLASVPDARSVVLTLPPIPDGIYSVRWSVVSTIDSHVTEGTVVFGVGDDALAVATAAVGTPDAPIHGWEVFLRWLDLTALALAIGGLVVGRWVVPTHRPAGWASATIRRRALGEAGWAAAAAVAVGFGLLAWQVVSIGTSDAGEGSAGSVAGQVLFHGRWATLWTARQLSLLALVALVFSIRRGRTAQVAGGVRDGRCDRGDPCAGESRRIGQRSLRVRGGRRRPHGRCRRVDRGRHRSLPSDPRDRLGLVGRAGHRATVVAPIRSGGGGERGDPRGDRTARGGSPGGVTGRAAGIRVREGPAREGGAGRPRDAARPDERVRVPPEAPGAVPAWIERRRSSHGCAHE